MLSTTPRWEKHEVEMGVGCRWTAATPRQGGNVPSHARVLQNVHRGWRYKAVQCSMNVQYKAVQCHASVQQCQARGVPRRQQYKAVQSSTACGTKAVHSAVQGQAGMKSLSCDAQGEKGPVADMRATTASPYIAKVTSAMHWSHR